MERSRLDAAALLLALAVGGALLFLAAPANFGYVTTIAGFILLIVLLAYDQEGARSVLQSLAFATVTGFALMLASGILYEYSLAHAANVTGPAAQQDYLQTRFALTWVFATILFWAIDRARMSGRIATEARSVLPGTTVGRAFIPDLRITPAPPVSHAAPAPPRPEPTVSSAPTPVYSATQVSPPPIIPPQRPAFEELVESIPVAPPKPETASPPPTAPAPQPIPVTGKVSPIYVNLVGEGLNVLRSVQAEHLGHDFYRIVDNMPEGEEWAFGPGQVVRCRKQKLSSGKALVAYEEAPRAQSR
jgi:hypothetical protein